MPAAVLLHPHPDYGGNKYNNVVAAFFERFSLAGITPHRFDFRSSNLDFARQQAVDAIERAGEPVWLMGYSFGGAIAATVDHPAVIGWCFVAPALSLTAPTIGADPREKYVIAAEHDAAFGPAALADYTAQWVATSSTTVEGTDHFFGGSAAYHAANLAAAWIESQGLRRESQD